MPSKPKVSREEAQKLFSEGMTAEELAEHFNVSVSTIYRRLRAPEISTVPYREMNDGKSPGKALPQGSIVKGRR